MNNFYLVWACWTVALTAMAAVASGGMFATRRRVLMVSGVFALCAAPFPFFSPDGGGFYPAGVILLAVVRDPRVAPMLLLALPSIFGVWIVTFLLLNAWGLAREPQDG